VRPSFHRRSGRPAPGGLSASTRAAYRADLAFFWSWARIALSLVEGYPVASEVVIQYVRELLQGLDPATDQALVELGAKARLGPLRVATVERRLNALGAAHRDRELDNPCRHPDVSALLSRARRQRHPPAAESQRGPCRVGRRSFALSPSVAERVRDAAHFEGVPEVEIVETAIRRHLSTLERRRGRAFPPRPGGTRPAPAGAAGRR